MVEPCAGRCGVLYFAALRMLRWEGDSVSSEGLGCCFPWGGLLPAAIPGAAWPGGRVAGVPRKGPLQFTPGLGFRAGRCFRLPAFRECCSLWFRSCGLSVHGCLLQSATAV